MILIAFYDCHSLTSWQHIATSIYTTSEINQSQVSLSLRALSALVFLHTASSLSAYCVVQVQHMAHSSFVIKLLTDNLSHGEGCQTVPRFNVHKFTRLHSSFGLKLDTSTGMVGNC